MRHLRQHALEDRRLEVFDLFRLLRHEASPLKLLAGSARRPCRAASFMVRGDIIPAAQAREFAGANVAARPKARLLLANRAGRPQDGEFGMKVWVLRMER